MTSTISNPPSPSKELALFVGKKLRSGAPSANKLITVLGNVKWIIGKLTRSTVGMYEKKKLWRIHITLRKISLLTIFIHYLSTFFIVVLYIFIIHSFYILTYFLSYLKPLSLLYEITILYFTLYLNVSLCLWNNLLCNNWNWKHIKWERDYIFI